MTRANVAVRTALKENGFLNRRFNYEMWLILSLKNAIKREQCERRETPFHHSAGFLRFPSPLDPTAIDHVSGAFLRRIMLRSAKWVFSRTLFICGEVLTSISTHRHHPWEILKRHNVELHDNQHHRLPRAFARLPPFPTFS